MDSSNLACSFRQLVFNAWYGWFQYRELYTRSSLDRWVDFRFNSWRCDNWYYGRGCPSSRLYRLGNTWWNRICRRSCNLLYRCSSCYLVCACKSHHRRSWNCSSCSSNRCSRWDNRYCSFLRYSYNELALATHWLESR